MAATDQNYRSQRILDIVFAASCVLLLLSTVWMFADDFFKEWKQDQNTFNDADETMDVLDALNVVPSEADVTQAEEEVKSAEQSLKNDPAATAAESTYGLNEEPTCSRA